MGTKIVQFHVDISEQMSSNIIEWNSMVTNGKTLKDLAGRAHADIKANLRLLEVKRQGRFIESKFTESNVEEEDSECLYIYDHGESFAYYSVYLSKVTKFCRIEEDEGFLKPCRNTKCHQHYLPYFYSNKHCRSMIEDTCPALSTFFNKGKFGDNKSAALYAEDDWTHRLYRCLQIENIHAEYTADLRGYHTKRSYQGRIPLVLRPISLLFRGAPDLIIKAKNDEGMVDVASLGNVGSDDNLGDDRDVPSDGDSSPSSQDSGRLQMGHQP